MNTTTYGGPEVNKTERKIRRTYLQAMARVASVVPLDEPMTKEIFSKMWNENYIKIYSSKISDKIWNTAADQVSENVLRPIGVRYGFIPNNKTELGE